MPSANSNREVQTTVSMGHLKEQLTAFMYASGLVQHNEDIVDLKFSAKDIQGNSDLIPLTITFKKQQEVKFIKHNGGT